MGNRALLCSTAALASLLPSPAGAQSTDSAFAFLTPDADSDSIIVTARKRRERLFDVPVSATMLSGETMAGRGIYSVRDAALLSPGLNINGDGVGRAFIAIRGVGVTLVQSVQPGVGIFIDGIYQPNTAYLNNPLVDVERIEVLRGPQGTLYGKNTLGGAINIISRVPDDSLSVRASTSYAGPDDQWTAAASLSGAIVPGRIQARIGYFHRQQDGFLTNSQVGGKANPLDTDSVNAMVRILPGDAGAVLTVKGYYDRVSGVNSPYSRVAGPADYSRTVPFNALNRVRFRYRGINARLEIPVGMLNGTVTLVGAHDARSGYSPDSDGDFGPTDIIRSTSRDELRTTTAELRVDSRISGTLTTLVGLFHSHEDSRTTAIDAILPRNSVRTTGSHNRGDSYAAFGTLFWAPGPAWDISLGLRYDHEDRVAQGSVVTTAPTATIGGALPDARLTSDQVEPRLSVTRHWSPELMSYASVARGYRGGGFNAPAAPNRVYGGDFAWTYELGSRYASADRRLTLSGAIFYNDYRHYIGLNSVAPLAPTGFVTVDLNSGTVESYGVELEATVRPVSRWRIAAGATLIHARLTDSREYSAVTRRSLASDRLPFQPDWTFNLHSDYAIPVGSDELIFGTGIAGKGRRLAATLNPTTATFLNPYYLVDASITYRRGIAEFSLFANNLFNERYFDSYIEKTTLQLANIPPSDVGIVGDRRRIGVRTSLIF